MIKVFRSPSVLLCIGGGELAGSCCFEFLWELGVEVRPRQDNVLAVCLFLREQMRGLVSPRSSSVNSL